jgi:D-amino-acid dehydrogenase
MKVIVLGSGLLGVTTAYELAKRGYEVTVIDRQQQSGAETSFANGGQLSYSHAEPWASPSVLAKLPKWLFKEDAPLVFRLRADLPMIKWGLSFLRNCTSQRASVNCVNLLRLGMYSKRKLEDLVKDTSLSFDYATKGILHIYGTEKDFDHAKEHNDFQAKFGCHQRVLTRQQVMDMEPAFAKTSRQIVGAIHADMDACGDAFTYCNELAAYITRQYGVKFEYGHTIEKLRVEGDNITAVVTDKGELSADMFVMSMGSYSPLVLNPIGIKLPIYPMKGYSITLEANEHCPTYSVTDGTYKIVYSRLGNRMRVAGTAEFAGHNTEINEARIAPIVKAASELFPGANWSGEIKKWACLRPSTPDGPPVLGTSIYHNLFLNTGHGTLGWTQAAGSAAIVADIIEGKTPEILTQGLTMERYL